MTDKKPLVYWRDSTFYKLIEIEEEDEEFSLLEARGKYPADDWETLRFSEIEKLFDLNDFSSYLAELERPWFEAQPIQLPAWSVQAILDNIAMLKQTQELSYREHRLVYAWEGRMYDAKKDTKFEQYCPNCEQEVDYNPRYPKSLCRRCKELTTDQEGRPVEYFNEAFGGYGCAGFYKGTKQKEKYESDTCFIGSAAYKAQEAKFGGIVINKADLDPDRGWVVPNL